MAEAGAHSSDSDEENSTHKSNVGKCERKLKALKLSSHGKSKWYGGSTHKHDKGKTDREGERLSKASVLITAITAGDVVRSAQLLDLIPLRALNKLSSVSVNQGTFKVTPLLWGVIHSRVEIVQLLIDRGVNIDRQGYLENDDVTYTYTPLIRALDNGDRDMVALLLKSGADPYLRVSGPRISEEEGGVVRYTIWLYPATRAVTTNDVDIVRMFIEKYDPLTVYTSNHHMCLCFALSKQKLTNMYEIVKCIISYGGKVCNGTGEENPRDKGICTLFKRLVRNAFSIDYTNNDVKFRCNFNAFKVLSLVCQTDYTQPRSSITKALKQYFKIFDRDKFRYGQYGFVCQKSYDCFTYMMNYSETAAPLKQICRVVIRNSIQSWNPTMCSKLPLPPKLQSYVGFMDEE